jgi:hypothetical protein
MTDAELNAEYQRYCLAAGHLFTHWGCWEQLLTGTLKLHLAMNIGDPADTHSIKLASAIYGSLRFSSSRETVKRLLKVEKAPAERISFMDAIFMQAKHIENFRNRLSHDVVVPSALNMGGYWQVTDAVNSRDLAALNVWVFDTAALHQAAHDLDVMTTLIGSYPITNALFSGVTSYVLPEWAFRADSLKLIPRSRLRTLNGDDPSAK